MRIVTMYRHILPDNTLKKVEFDKETQKYYIKGTDTELTTKQICRKHNLKGIAPGKYVFDKKKKRKGYSDWWQENNLNGGFAYNGVTDDF